MNFPASCEVEALAEWTRATWNRASSMGGSSKYADKALASAVLALLTAKVRKAVEATKESADPYCECDSRGTGGRIHLRMDDADTIVSRVLSSGEGAK